MWRSIVSGVHAARVALRNRRSSVAIMSAAMFPVLIGLSGMVVEYGNGIAMKAKLQQIADSAAYGGAIAYTETSSTATMNNAVSRIATLNGIATSAASASLVNSPSGDGNQAVRVNVTGTAPLSLARIWGGSSQLAVEATSYAEVKSTSTSCIVALSHAGTGVVLSGGTALSAPGCSVQSNSAVVAPYGTSITTPKVTYDSSSDLVIYPGNTNPASGQHIVAPAGKTLSVTKAVAPDPLSGNATVTGEIQHLNGLALMSGPSVPNPPAGTNVTFNWSSTSVPWSSTTMSAAGCSATPSNGTWTVTCVGNGPFNFGNISIAGGVSLNVKTTGSTSTPTYNFSGDIDASGGAGMTFGPGSYTIHGGIVVGYGVVSFGAGTFNIGKLSTSCSGGSGYSICNTGTLTIGGPSSFSLTGGIYDGGGANLALGTSTIGNTSPTTNSFSIGSANDGNSLNILGGGKTTLADASGVGGVFQAMGNVVTSGGSCLVLSAATDHDINGYMSTAGGVYLGSGRYNIADYVVLGASGGGDVTCTVNGVSQTIGMTGYNVTFGMGAAYTPGSGTCAGMAFCIAGGYGNVTLTAPSSGADAGLAVIGPTSSTNTAGALFTEGAGGTSLSGAFYLPNGSVTLSGGASLGSGSGQCLELIGSQVTMKGGAVLASSCAGLGGTSGTAIVLVQ